MKVLRCDVLVVGSGAAGLLAALAARREGSDVLLVSKTPLGRGNCTMVSGAVFRCASEGFSPEDHFRQTLEVGRHLNFRDLVRTLAVEAAHHVAALATLGVPLRPQAKGYYCDGPTFAEGWGITRPLTEVARASGVRELVSALAWDLIGDSQGLAGVLVYSFAEDQWLLVEAPSVVLACGGAGALYRYTDNPPRTTGDGYALALRAGLPLVDMEFVQFYPVAAEMQGVAHRYIPPMAVDAGRLVNSSGEHLQSKYGLPGERLAVEYRDLLSRAVARESGAGHAVFLDLTGATDDDWQRTFPDYGESRVRRIRAHLEAWLPLTEVPIQIVPTCHFFMGGIPIDSQGATARPGVFAAGEVTGGLHGANRLGGNAISEAVVFGERAGRAAARHARLAGRRSLPADVRDRIPPFPQASAGPRPSDLTPAIRQLAWDALGVVRTAGKLGAAIGQLTELAERSRKGWAPGGAFEKLRFLENTNLLLVAESVARASLVRTESRGALFREDYPETDPGWLRHVEVTAAPRIEVRVTERGGRQAQEGGDGANPKG